MKRGDVLGHEFMGEVVEVGRGVKNLAIGDRVVVPFPIACGHCLQCEREMYSLCENTNPNAWMAEKLWGYSPCGIFGYSHMLGGYAGGQAEYVRVPFADVGPDQGAGGRCRTSRSLFLSDIFPTGYMAADMCGIQPGDTVAVWGCGPGRPVCDQERISARRRTRDRASTASPTACGSPASKAGAETLNYEEVDVPRGAASEMTGGRGPDHCIDAVGMEGHAPGLHGAYDRVKTAMMLETDRPPALRQAILACRSGGTVSVAGVYGGFIDKFPIGAIVNRSLTIRSGQCHVQRYMRPLLRADPEWRDRSELRHHPSTAARGRAGGLRHVHEQGGRVPEGGAEDIDSADRRRTFGALPLARRLALAADWRRIALIMADDRPTLTPTGIRRTSRREFLASTASTGAAASVVVTGAFGCSSPSAQQAGSTTAQPQAGSAATTRASGRILLKGGCVLSLDSKVGDFERRRRAHRRSAHRRGPPEHHRGGGRRSMPPT